MVRACCQRYLVRYFVFYLHLQSSLNSVCKQLADAAGSVRRRATNMSRGYTIAFARTAPVAPAIALPHGGSGAAFVGGAIWLSEAQCLVPSLSGAAYANR